MTVPAYEFLWSEHDLAECTVGAMSPRSFGSGRSCRFPNGPPGVRAVAAIPAGTRSDVQAP